MRKKAATTASVARLVEAHNRSYAHVFQFHRIVGGTEEALAIHISELAISDVFRPLKRHKFARNHLVQVAIRRVFEISVLIKIGVTPQS